MPAPRARHVSSTFCGDFRSNAERPCCFSLPRPGIAFSLGIILAPLSPTDRDPAQEAAYYIYQRDKADYSKRVKEQAAKYVARA